MEKITNALLSCKLDELPPEWQKLIGLTRAEMYVQEYWKRQRKGSTKERKAYEMLQNIREEISKLDLKFNTAPPANQQPPSDQPNQPKNTENEPKQD
jgi:hypothetical protein